MKKQARRQNRGRIRNIAVANHILADDRLYPTTKRVLSVLLAFRGRKNHVNLTLVSIARLSHCSISTVQQAIRQLLELGYLEKLRQHRYSPYLDRIVYAANRYKLCNCSLEEGYTLIPWSLVGADITHSAFVVALNAYRWSGRKGRCYPSLRHMAKTLTISKATVVRALQQLRQLQILVKLYCVKKNRSYACNTYFVTEFVRKQAKKIFDFRGGLIFSKPLDIKKITKVLISRKNIYGICEFGNLPNFEPDSGWERPFYFDGTGVRVSAGDEPEITA